MDDRIVGVARSGRGGGPPPWLLAAVNFNEARVTGSAYDEASDGKLGSVYTAVAEVLVGRGDWERLPAERDRATNVVMLPNTFNLLLGTAQGKGINWSRLGYGIWPPPLANYAQVRLIRPLRVKPQGVESLTE